MAKPAMSAADQDAATERGLEQYRRMLKADPWDNPALLDSDRGEALWSAKKGPHWKYFSPFAFQKANRMMGLPPGPYSTS
jgi:hypothetical protein